MSRPAHPSMPVWQAVLVLGGAFLGVVLLCAGSAKQQGLWQ